MYDTTHSKDYTPMIGHVDILLQVIAKGYQTFGQTYDVTELLRRGRNAVGAQLSGGWWTGCTETTRCSLRFCGLLRLSGWPPCYATPRPGASRSTWSRDTSVALPRTTSAGVSHRMRPATLRAAS